MTTLVSLALTVEVLLRLYALGIPFFDDTFNCLDLVVMITTLLAELVLEYVGQFLIIFRLIRVVRVGYLGYRGNTQLKVVARQQVSANRRRYIDDDFDIDITYITDRMIAMSVPSVGTESFYRNPVDEVARFFNTKHGSHYRIYNLCEERNYPESGFEPESICKWPMEDHNVVPLHSIFELCEDAAEFLEEDDLNVVALHCKGGKGRTGTMICSLMLFMGLFSNPDAALDYFAERRTNPDAQEGTVEGVETPSQARYVHYMARVMREGFPDPHPLYLEKVQVENFARLHSSTPT